MLNIMVDACCYLRLRIYICQLIGFVFDVIMINVITYKTDDVVTYAFGYYEPQGISIKNNKIIFWIFF